MNVEISSDNNLPTVVFLHGFTGCAASWSEISKLLKDKCRTVAVDLTGHGKSSIPEDADRYSMDQQVKDLEALFAALSLNQFILVGYSMGGRVALAYTVRYPKRVSSLILESSSPGLKTENERTERKEADSRLAERILTDGLPAFVDFWESIPLFASQKSLTAEKRLMVRTERLSQSETGLANSLQGIGTGSQESYWRSLGTINLPVLLITGELDTKFVNISREMQRQFPNVRHETIEHAGHAIHVEKPDTFATMIEKHISEVKNRGGSL
ncbi:2-succinyl-6-hydroxy-2,4-cyclohexadiene-1-carboxylate synthase [Sporosarcina sp. JAI121]|uniref:2-succinyl-6-hydroxy-2, 4-cyclohexadiene-1-carboxylate synthase n=1 Tax=Sporosarcina sp. JAI121 TaxID=2723064 RepID=UPI00182016D7|nr:2-succinyl-6-hydroxy-2,4-cyclohexadiene-1-carboxylate synthase [Sporosarcina sp. JAI121]NYF25526.1 2-succinyl-6-hydroxy-2,4-cyclohexadiene-1-carboxylate synthase [Sporosarcina sp. JAI121]